jgi:hypothetical protein
VSFYYYATDRAWVFREVVVWLIWLPIWAILIKDNLDRRGIDAAAEVRKFRLRR